MQTRTAQCFDHTSTENEYCDLDTKPPITQKCGTGISCPTKPPETTSEITIIREVDSDQEGIIAAPEIHHHSESSSSENVISSSGSIEGIYHPPPVLHPYLFPAKAERLIGEEVVPSEAT